MTLLAIILIAGSSCTSSDELVPNGSGSTLAEGESTTTAAPLMLALTPNLDLDVDTCWAELPELVETTTTTTEPPTETTPATAETTPQTLGDPATTIPSPTIVAEVDCSGTNEGKVFASFCLQQNPATDDLARFLLIATECDPTGVDAGNSPVDTPWPGDREVRRAAARLCLHEFEEAFGEPYSQSELVAKEFVPTEGIWIRGRRDVVCWIDSAS